MENILAARAGVYRILQNIFGNEPNRTDLENLRAQAARTVLDFFVLADTGKAASEYTDARQQLEELLEAELLEPNTFVANAAAAYTRLFVGPGPTQASPWESVYRSVDATLFSPDTLSVRRDYVEAGFIPSAYPQVADDHIGLELDFMQRLAQEALNAYSLSAASSGGDASGYSAFLRRSADFLDAHLLTWVEAFSQQIHQAAPDSFYQRASALLVGWLKLDRLILESTDPTPSFSVKACRKAPVPRRGFCPSVA
jgi:TorA maturation chaperone TorD